jgi:hypothetical protein
MNEKLTHTRQEMAQQGPQAPPAPVTVLILLIAVFMLALAGLLRLVQLRSAGATLAPPVAALAAAGEHAYYQYAYYRQTASRLAALICGAGTIRYRPLLWLGNADIRIRNQRADGRREHALRCPTARQMTPAARRQSSPTTL